MQIVADNAAACNRENQTSTVVQFRPRASNLAHAWLATADVTPTGYTVGIFLADRARFATAADVRRKVHPGEVFTYWAQRTIAEKLKCSERQVRRGVASLRAAGFGVRRLPRPRPGCGDGVASYVFPAVQASYQASGRASEENPVRDPRVPRSEPEEEHEQQQPETSCRKSLSESGDSDPRHVCPVCKNDWPQRFGRKCYKCGFRLPAPAPAPAPVAARCKMERGGKRCTAPPVEGSVFCETHRAERCESCTYLTRQCRCRKGATDERQTTAVRVRPAAAAGEPATLQRVLPGVAARTGDPATDPET